MDAEELDREWPEGTRVVAIRNTNGNSYELKYAYKTGDVGTVSKTSSARAGQLEVLFDNGKGNPSTVYVGDGRGRGGAGIRKLTEVELDPLELQTPPEVEAVNAAARWVELFSTVESARRLRKCVMHAADGVLAGDHGTRDDDSSYVDAAVTWVPPGRRGLGARDDAPLTLCATHALDAMRAALDGGGIHPRQIVWVER